MYLLIVFNIKLLILLHINHLISGLPCYTKRIKYFSVLKLLNVLKA